MEKEFYVCAHCGNIITKITDKKVPVFCCGQKMDKLVAGTVDASLEKHVPVVNIEKNVVTVKVGSVEHPMVEEHFIQWIYIVTNKGEQIKYLSPNQKPIATFMIDNDEIVENVYEYCNLHGLWKN